MKSGRTQIKVDETGPCDLDLVDRCAVAERVDNERSDVARALACRFGEAHGDIACEIAVTRVARAFDCGAERQVACGIGEVGQRGESVGDEIGYDVFHGAQLNQNSSTGSTSIDQRSLRDAGSASSWGRSSLSAACSCRRSPDCRRSWLR